MTLLEKAFEVGKEGVPHSEKERNLFLEYLRGHCWPDGEWNKDTNEYSDRYTRVLYAVWRARGAVV